jgi:hypothetical protein
VFSDRKVDFCGSVFSGRDGPPFANAISSGGQVKFTDSADWSHPPSFSFAEQPTPSLLIREGRNPRCLFPVMHVQRRPGPDAGLEDAQGPASGALRRLQSRVACKARASGHDIASQEVGHGYRMPGLSGTGIGRVECTAARQATGKAPCLRRPPR